MYCSKSKHALCSLHGILKADNQQGKPLFLELHFYSWDGTSNTHINPSLVAYPQNHSQIWVLWHPHIVWRIHRLWGNFTPGNYLLFPVPLGRRWARPAEQEKEWLRGTRLLLTPLDPRVKITQPPPWAWRVTKPHKTAGEHIFLHIFFNVVLCNINRTVSQYESRLIWCVVFQSTSTETPGSKGSREKAELH